MGDSRTVVRAAALAGLGAAVLAADGRAAPAAAREERRVSASAQEDRRTAAAQEDRRAPAAEAGRGPDNRRDPFAGPAAPRAGAATGERPGGLAGLAVDDAVLRGIVRTREDRVAFLEAPDGRTYAVRPTDRLYDGAVQEIAADTVIFLRDAAGSAPGERVRKRLRGAENAR